MRKIIIFIHPQNCTVEPAIDRQQTSFLSSYLLNLLELVFNNSCWTEF